jgi:hypothetical protein
MKGEAFLSPETNCIALASEMKKNSDREVQIRGLFGEELHALPLPMAEMMSLCSRFRTVREHLRVLSEHRVFSGSPSLIQEGVKELRRRALLCTEEEILRTLASFSSGGSDSPPPVTVQAWVSSGITPELEENLRSYCAAQSSARGEHTCMIFDDSKQPDSYPRAKAVVQRINRELGTQIRYFGEKESRRLFKLLASGPTAGNIPERVIRFALYPGEILGTSFPEGTAAGANRNRLLLAAAGEMIMSSDSDHPWIFSEPPGKRCGLEISSEHDPTVTEYFPDHEELMNHSPPADTDITASHERLLGCSVSSLIRRSLYERTSADEGAEGAWPKRVSLERAGRPLLTELMRKDGTVRITMTGMYGRSGTGSPHHILFVRGKNREKVLGDEERYERMVKSDLVRRGTGCCTIGGGSFFMAMNIGLDNRSLLPPFFPAGRNADGIFAKVMRRADGSALIGYLPRLIYHSPRAAARWSREDLHRFRLRTADILPILLDTLSGSSGSNGMAAGLKDLGEHLMSFGPMPLEDFRGRVFHVLERYFEALIPYTRSEINYYRGQPAFWARDLERHIEQIEAYFSEKRGGPISTIPDELLQQYIASYGELLIWWPEIVEKARSIKTLLFRTT